MNARSLGIRFAAGAGRALAILTLVGAANGCGNAGTGMRLGDQSTLSGVTSVGTTPMFAVSSTGTHALAWVSAPNGGTDGRLYIAVAGGTPVEIRDTLGPVEAHGESPPEMSFGPKGALYAAYTVGREVPGERFPRSALRLVKSTNGGATWSEPVTVTDGPVFGSHMFQALHVASDGTVYVSWLGKPEGDSASTDTMTMTDDMHSDSGGMNAMHMASAAWIVRSTDGGTTWMPRVRVDLGEACPCCRTSLATASDGTLYIAWRHVYPGNVRDIVVARSTDHGATWSTPVKVHEDDWHFDACPHAGPSIALDTTGTLHVAWWTGKQGNAGVFYAHSTDGARTFSAPRALGTAPYSQPAHVQLALASNHRVVVAWDDGTKKVPQVVARVSPDGGAHFDKAVVVSAAGRAGTFPVLGVSGDSVSIAWSDQSPSAVHPVSEGPAGAGSHGHMMEGRLQAVGDTHVLVRRGVLQ